MNSPIRSIADRVVGTVEEVSADKILVLLDPDAPQATALNTGLPERFPRINAYILIPNETGATVGWVTSVKIERLPFPKRKGMQDFGLVDLPFPCRMVTLTPLGTLIYRLESDSGVASFELRRGIDVFPSVGDPVLLPTRDQLQAIVEGESGRTRRVLIGRCPTGGDAPVYVDPDKLFGRHLAVLGNTGAGKSCSVAGLIRWCIDSANEERKVQGRKGFVNARFIILDPNGEYAHAFHDQENVRLFQVQSNQGANARPLKVPAWLWNGEEWAAFTSASPGVQRPILFEALRCLRSEDSAPDPFVTKVRWMVQNYRDQLKDLLRNGDYLKKGKCENVAQVLLKATIDFKDLEQNYDGNDECLKEILRTVSESAAELETSAQEYGRDGKLYHKLFAGTDIESVVKLLDNIANHIGMTNDGLVANEDTPRYFPVDELPPYIEALASRDSRDLIQFVDYLNLRIRGLMHRGGVAQVLHPDDSASIKLEDWLTDYIGGDSAANGQIVIVDLSLVPSEVIHIIVAVLARLTFEALQRYRREMGEELPTVLVLEEAHTFAHKDLAAETASAAGRVCCRIFERIAREGRKFGLGLVLASQRPSEISPTVLSQCNTFLLHRIVNDHDQDLVRRLVPDGLGAVLRELPSLPSRRGILVGWAAPAPVLVEMRDLPESQRPQSPDPAFWAVWTGDPKCGQRTINWAMVARRWTETTIEAQDEVSEGRESCTGASGRTSDNDDIPF